MTEDKGAARAPLVSVLMPVRNAMPFLDDAIRSILNQTMPDFELIIGDDASTDGSSERIAYWSKRDPRIRAFRRDEASGPAGSSNWVAEQARSEFLARMDADDISSPDRLERQIEIMKARPDVVLLGSLWFGIDLDGRRICRPHLAGLFNRGPLYFPWAHGSVMLRNSAFKRVGGYRAACDFWEDADLFHRMSGEGRIAVMIDPAYHHRFTTASNRLTIDMERLARQHVLRQHCCDALARQGTYEDVLRQKAAVRALPLPLMPFQKRASMAVRAGKRTFALFDWLALDRSRRGRFTFQEVVFLLWGAVAPKSLRFALDQAIGLRNLGARQKLGKTELFEWS